MNIRQNLLNLLAFVSMLAAIHAASAQNVVNGVLQGSPRSFMYLPQNPNPTTDWVKPTYGSSYSNPTASTGISGSNTTNHSHAFITRAANGSIPTDCAACELAFGNQYDHLYKLPLAWDSPNYTDGLLHFEDTVIQVGCDQSQGNKSQQMEYKFIPDEDNPVLLVNYMLVMENKTSGHGYPGSGIVNPTITIEVQNATTGALLPLGYYPRDYITNGNEHQGVASYNNTNWPYARYKFIAPGAGTGDQSSLTPSAFTLQPKECPQAQACNCSSDAPSTVAYDFTTVAFNLTEQAANHTPVKFIIKVQACSASAHWAYIYYTAKMVPGEIKGDVCNCDTVIKIEVPYGFDANTYHWYYGIDPENVNPNTMAPLGDLAGFQTVRLNRNSDMIFPYYRCEMTSMTGVPFVYEAFLRLFDLQPSLIWKQEKGNCEYKIHFDDSSRVSVLTPRYDAALNMTLYDTTIMNTWQRTWLYRDENGNIRPLDGGHANDRSFDLVFNNVDPDTPIPVGLAITDDNNTCFDTLWTNVIFDDAYVMAPTSEDTIITCEETITYDAATFGDLYTWNSPGRRPVVYPGAAWNGCDSTVYVYYEIQKPRINEVLSSDDYCDAFHTTLSVDASVDVMAYHWSYKYNTDTTFEEGVNPTAPTITITRPGTYSVTITDESGCVASDEITIDACVPFINLPNAITPSNYDGLNDCVEVIQRDLLESLEFMVYNRFGELVYYTEDKNFCWDGRVKGELKTNVTYNWVLKTVDYNGTYKMYKGSIVVL